VEVGKHALDGFIRAVCMSKRGHRPISSNPYIPARVFHDRGG
jgi:hypothetical protein